MSVTTATAPSVPPRTAERVAAATPAGRDRFLDLIRVLALGVVVLGHWLMAVVWTDGEGFHASSLLAEAPAARWLTWVLQVMPLFFVVGGFANATSLASAARRGTGYGQWVRGRVVRLFRPVVPVLVVWLGLAVVLPALGVADDVVVLSGRNALVPLWFLATYVLVIAVAPVAVTAHRRWGWRVPVGALAVAAAVDVAHRAGVPLIGWTNFLFVWGGLHQLGFLWHDGTLARSGRVRWGLVVGGVVGLAVLVGALDYPVSMVGVPGAGRSNNLPPTVALAALGAGQTGLALLVRDRANRWLARPQVWAVVAGAGAVAMSVYLWHMTTMTVLAATVLAGWWPDVAPLSAAWWLGRPLWVLLNAALLFPVVRLAAPVERRAAVRAAFAGPAPAARTALLALVVCGSLATVVRSGVAAPGRGVPARVELVAVLVAALVGLGAYGTERAGRATTARPAGGGGTDRAFGASTPRPASNTGQRLERGGAATSPAGGAGGVPVA